MSLDIYSLIDGIRSQPRMYLREDAASLLDAFLSGYLAAAYAYGDSLGKEDPPFGDFGDWVAYRLGYGPDNSGSVRLLLESENGDEAKAFEKFFVFLDEFKQRKATVILSAVPDSGKSWKYQIVDGERIDFPLPALVQIVKYDEGSGVFIRYLDQAGKLIDREEYFQNIDVALSWTERLIDKTDWKKPG